MNLMMNLARHPATPTSTISGAVALADKPIRGAVALAEKPISGAVALADKPG
jgi:hypothetical protein